MLGIISVWSSPHSLKSVCVEWFQFEVELTVWEGSEMLWQVMWVRSSQISWPSISHTWQGSHGLWRSLKVWGKWDKLFKALKVCENGVGSVKVCGPQSAREELSVYQSETHFPRPNSSLKNKQIWPCKITKNEFLSVLTNRVRWPSAAVRVAPL